MPRNRLLMVNSGGSGCDGSSDVNQEGVDSPGAGIAESLMKTNA